MPMNIDKEQKSFEGVFMSGVIGLALIFLSSGDFTLSLLLLWKPVNIFLTYSYTCEDPLPDNNVNSCFFFNVRRVRDFTWQRESHHIQN